jgi:phosphoenolpyruvate---glycerone phosphotransferase subunit DhaL
MRNLGLVEVRRAIDTAITRVVEARNELCELDAVAGDGDLGSTLAHGFEAARREALDNSDDISALLTAIGRTLAMKAPSTMGTLLGTAFMRAGKEMVHTDALDAAGVALMLQAMATSVAERGRAAVGERTVLDPMIAAAHAAAQSSASDASPRIALAVAAGAARTAADATAIMTPKHGRAGWIGERARGRPDAGASAWAIYLTGLSDGAQGAPGAEPAPNTKGAAW